MAKASFRCGGGSLFAGVRQPQVFHMGQASFRCDGGSLFAGVRQPQVFDMASGTSLMNCLASHGGQELPAQRRKCTVYPPQ